MERFVRGNIVVIPFPFSDLTSVKKRPALVLAVLDRDDILLCQITSKYMLDKHAIEIKSPDFEKGSLPSTSYVRCGKLFTAHISIVERIAGSIKMKALDSISELNASIIIGKETYQN